MRVMRSRKSLLDQPVSAFLGVCFVLWPMLSNIWGSFRLTSAVGYIVPMIVMGAIAMGALFVGRGFKRSHLYWWLLFVGVVVILTAYRSMGTFRSALTDFLLMFFCCIVCLMLFDRELDLSALLRCIYLCGLFVSLTVILDKTTGIFRNELIGLYTESYRAAKTSMRGTAGIFVHLGTAGGYICPGVVAYICLRRDPQKKFNASNWIVCGIFLLAFLIIHKRGFTLDMLIAPFMLWIFGWGTDRNKKFNPRRNLSVLFSLILLAGVLVTIYFTVPFVREQADSFLARFDTDDDTLSGRTKLYLLAWNLFRQNPVFGIGWGRYRTYSSGIFGKTEKDYAAHNIYLQLLAETGVVGTILFLVAVGVTLLVAVRAYRRLRREGADAQMIFFMQAGIFLQLFFLLYGMSGNPLYDDNFLVSYFSGVLISMAVPYQYAAQQQLPPAEAADPRKGALTG